MELCSSGGHGAFVSPGERSSMLLLASLGALLALSGALACSADQTPAKGELMVAVSTDMSPGVKRDFDKLGVDIYRSGQALKNFVFDEVGNEGLLTLPATLAIVGNDDPKTTILLRVWTELKVDIGGEQKDEARTLVEVSTTIPADRIALLRVPMQWLCLGSGEIKGNYVEGVCDEGTSCIGGKCLDWNVDSSTLPTYDPKLVFGGGSAEGDGTCFDTLACFASDLGGYVVPMSEIDTGTCSIASPGGGGPINVALVTERGQGGICYGAIDRCLVPLDESKVAGWHEDNGRIVLPPGVCTPEKFFSGKMLEIAVTTGCATKTEQLPTCGPWSTVDKPDGTFDAAPPTGLGDGGGGAGGGM